MNASKFARAAWLVLTAAALACTDHNHSATVASAGVAITTSLPPDRVAHPGQTVEFTVTATAASGHLVKLTLIDPPPGCAFAPVVSTKGPAVGHVRWLVPTNWGGARRFDFRAVDLQNSKLVSTVSVPIRIDGSSNPVTFAVGDVTGDGILDTVALASAADVGGVADVGAIYVWKGTTQPTGVPDATLVVPGAKKTDALGAANGQTLQLVDVTGDGVLDVVCQSVVAEVDGQSHAGAVYVWRGGPSLLSPSTPPSATLTSPTPGPDEDFGLANQGQAMQFVDLTGDGILDVVVTSIDVTESGQSHAGAIFVWQGGPSLVKSARPAPLATLAVPGVVKPDEFLGDASGQGVQFADVTGDGFLDVIAGTPHADVNGVVDAGAVYVWQGGPALATNSRPAPIATLTAPNASANDELGLTDSRGFLLADVTGDGVVDLVVGAKLADVNGVADAGAIYVWQGGAALLANSTPPPLATLSIPKAKAQDELSSPTFLAADVTGDGVLDVVAGAQFADLGGVANVGAIYVWQGGATLQATPAPTAALTVPNAISGDRLGDTSGHGDGILVADVTGDGLLDVVGVATHAEVNGVASAGAIYVWQGGPSLLADSSPAPLVTLAVPGASTSDQLGSTTGQGVELVDVTGDGFLDVVAGSPTATGDGVARAGAIYVFQGGPNLAPNPAPGPTTTLFVPNATMGDELGTGTSSQAVQFADVTGDGVLDVVVANPWATIGGIFHCGAVHVWQGGVSLLQNFQEAPIATLALSNPTSGDQLGSAFGQSVSLADVNGDGVLDLVVGAMSATVNGVADAGEVVVWSGGAPLLNDPLHTPLATLTLAQPTADDELGFASGQGVVIADVTGDGVPDVLVAGARVDLGGVQDVGAIALWRGGALASKQPDALLAVPGAVKSDQLAGSPDF